MSNILLHSVVPQNEKATYSQGDQIDFLIDFPGRKLIPGSVRLEALCETEKSAGVANDTNFLQLDNQAGAHCFIDSVTTEMANLGVVETINSDYARYVKMKTQASVSKADLNTSRYVPEWRASERRTSSLRLRNKVNINKTAATQVNFKNDFSIKPDICLNNLEGGNLSYLKSGYCKVSFTLARDLNVLMGPAQVAGSNYELSNLRLKFQSIPEDNMNNNLVMNTIYVIKQGIQSSSANISSKVPSVCKGVVGSFLKQSSDNAIRVNGHATNLPPSMAEIRFLFNDASNNLLTYSLRNINDQILKGSKALGGGEGVGNQLTPSDRGANDGYLFGVNFDKNVNLTNTKFNAQFDSAIASTVPYNCYLYFMGVVSL